MNANLFKTGLLFLAIITNVNAYAQVQSGKLSFSEDCNGWDDAKKISVELKDSALRVFGKTYANCCGTPYLEYEISNNNILLTRIDTAFLCNCICVYEIDTTIPMPLLGFDYYNVKLDGYFGDDAVDTTITLYTSIIDNCFNTIIAPNPFNESAIIMFHNPSSNNFTFELFDESGTLVRTQKNITSNQIQIFKGELKEGIYIYCLHNSETNFTEKGTIIIQ